MPFDNIHLVLIPKITSEEVNKMRESLAAPAVWVAGGEMRPVDPNTPQLRFHPHEQLELRLTLLLSDAIEMKRKEDFLVSRGIQFITKQRKNTAGEYTLEIVDPNGIRVQWISNKTYQYTGPDSLTDRMFEDSRPGPGGLTWREANVMHHLVEAWNEFLRLTPGHYSREEFIHAIHAAQSVIGRYVLSRLYPEYWNKPRT